MRHSRQTLIHQFEGKHDRQVTATDWQGQQTSPNVEVESGEPLTLSETDKMLILFRPY